MSKVCYRLLLSLACLQLLAVALGNMSLRGIGMASVASPLPRVFTSSVGLEAFSSRYVLFLGDRRGQVQEVTITPELYARLRGPYNRRNPYGAVVAFGPLLHARPETRAMFMSVARHALCGEAPLLRELGVDADEVVGPRRLLQLPRRGTRTEVPLSLEISCR